MKEIKGQKFLTIHATSDEVYELDYVTPPRLNILNCTEGDLIVCKSKSFTDSEMAGEFMTLPSGVAANSISFPFNMVYIKAASDGDIVIERCG